MPMSVVINKEVWDVVVPRHTLSPLVPVWMRHDDEQFLLCQVSNSDRFDWTVVVAGPVRGPRLVDGFKARWQAIQYAIKIRIDLTPEERA